MGVIIAGKLAGGAVNTIRVIPVSRSEGRSPLARGAAASRGDATATSENSTFTGAGKPLARLSGMGCYASPTVSNMQAAIASCGDFAPRTRKSNAG